MDFSGKNILVSFSGGKTSAYLAYRMKIEFGDKSNLLFVFANTGKENPETLDFVRKCDAYFGLNLVWVERSFADQKFAIVDFDTASRNGEPFEGVISKYGIPNTGYPHCTRELKIEPIHAFAKSFFGSSDYLTAIGIRVDEFDRMSIGNGKIYPLVKWGIRKADINSFWNQMPFNLELEPFEGNCDVCWKKSDKKLIQIAQKSPHKFDWWNKMENKYGDFVPESQKMRGDKPITFFRGYKSAFDILKTASDNGIQLSFFDDTPNGCKESCEVN